MRTYSCTLHLAEHRTIMNTKEPASDTTWKPQVTFLLLMKFFRPRLCIVVEQPTSSWLFKQRCWKEVTKRWKLEKHLTHQGFFGHDLLKPTHLMGNFSSLQAIETRATKDKKKAHKKEVKRRQARLKAQGERPKSYYRRLPGGGFQGGPDLAASAVYPEKFVLALYKCWLDSESQWVWSSERRKCELWLWWVCAETLDALSFNEKSEKDVSPSRLKSIDIHVQMLHDVNESKNESKWYKMYQTCSKCIQMHYSESRWYQKLFSL